MLFDTSSPGRKRIIRVVYSLLAALFLIGFVGFGVGGNFSGGGILDALGITDGDNNSTSDQYAQQIDDTEAKLDKDPQNQRALLNLTRYRFLSGSSQLNQDDQGQPVVTTEAKDEFEKSVAAWSRYLKTKPDPPDQSVAAFASQAYVALQDAKGAADAQEIVADANPSPQVYLQLALYRYADADYAGGDAAGQKALAEVKGSKQTKQLQKQLDSLRKRAKQQEAAIKAQAQAQGGDSGGALGDPFGALGGDSGSATGAPPTAP